MTLIQGTPGDIYLTYTPASSTAPTQLYLAGTAGKALLATLQAQYQSNALVAPLLGDLASFLQTPLNNLFTSLLQSNSAMIQAQVVSAIQSSVSGAYNVSASVPSSGALSAASYDGIGSDLIPLLPSATTGTTLVLGYQLSGLSVRFKVTTNSVFGSWADPGFQVTFDLLLQLECGIPASSYIAPVALATLTPSNFNTHGTNLTGDVAVVLADLVALVGVSTPLTSLPTAPISAPFSQLATFAGDAGQAITFAASLGFVQAGATVDPNPAGAQGTVPGPTVAILLTHPWDVPPSVSNALGVSGPSLINPVMSPSFLSVAAGASGTVYGNYFPPPQSTQISIRWTDTTSGSVVQSEIQYGQLAGPPPATGPTPAPAMPVDVVQQRFGSYDNLNTYTAIGLTPNTWYAFRVRDFDVTGLIATQWSPWLAIQTTAGNTVDLVITYGGMDHTIGTAVIITGGQFAGPGGSATINVDAATPPGTYALKAVQSGVTLAQIVLDVLAAGTQTPAMLMITNATTGQPTFGPANLYPEQPFGLVGSDFTPGLPVALSIDGTTPLGTVTADATGAFPSGGSSLVFTWPFLTGPHSVQANQGSVQSTAAVIGQYPLQ